MVVKKYVEAERVVWMVACALEEHFAALGGAVRYFDMDNLDITMYLGCMLMKKALPNLDFRHYVTSQFIQHALPVIPQIDLYMERIKVGPESLMNLAFDWIMHVDCTLKIKDHSIRWNEYILWVGSHIPDNSQRVQNALKLVSLRLAAGRR